MTDPLDSTEPTLPVKSEMNTHAPTIQKGSRFSLLLVGLTFVVALFLGMALGYGLGRSQSQPPDVVVVTTTPAEAVAQTSNNSTPPSEQSDSAAGPLTPTIMDFVLSDARHFQGSAGSPVTVVEFSDFK